MKINKATLLHIDCMEYLPTIAESSIDSIVCDPPYELGFMGKSWDASGIAYSVNMWQEALRVLKPGGHLLAFSGSRTYHRMTCAIEDAGFEVRDQILWVYGSGFPKSMNLKEQWQGWGTALKPAHEPICVARKPLTKGLTVAANVLAHGTGALNIDGCRVGNSKDVPASVSRAGSGNSLSGSADMSLRKETGEESGHNPNIGRWPANLIHDGSDEVVALFPDTETHARTQGGYNRQQGVTFALKGDDSIYPGSKGSAARFFYCAKTSKKDRGEENNHPTVKPTDLMRYLCRLVTPPNGTILDPFMGSGSTGKAAIIEGFNFIGTELHEEYYAIAKDRLSEIAESQIRMFA